MLSDSKVISSDSVHIFNELNDKQSSKNKSKYTLNYNYKKKRNPQKHANSPNKCLTDLPASSITSKYFIEIKVFC